MMIENDRSILQTFLSSGRFFPLLFLLAIVPVLNGWASYVTPHLVVHMPFLVLCQWLILGIFFALSTTKSITVVRPANANLLAALTIVGVSIFSAKFTAPSESAATYYLTSTVAHLLMAWLVYSAYVSRRAEEVRALFFAILVGITLQFILAYVVIALESGNPAYDWRRFYVGVSNVRHLGYLATIHVALAAGLLTTSDRRGERFIFALFLLFGLTFANLTGGRAAILAALGAALFCAIFGDKSRRKANLWLILALFAASIPLSMIHVPPGDHWGVDRLFLTLAGQTDTVNMGEGRMLLWERAIERFVEHPLIGYGVGQFRYMVRDLWVANHPHNTVLQSLVQWGLIGTAAAAVLLWTALRGSVSGVLNAPEHFVTPVAVVLGVGAVSVLDGPLYYPFPAMIFVIACALIKAASDARSEPAASIR